MKIFKYVVEGVSFANTEQDVKNRIQHSRHNGLIPNKVFVMEDTDVSEAIKMLEALVNLGITDKTRVTRILEVQAGFSLDILEYILKKYGDNIK